MSDITEKRIPSDHHGASRSFVGGFLDGVGVLSRVWRRGNLPAPRRYASGGIAADWAAIGRDFDAALVTWKADERA